MKSSQRTDRQRHQISALFGVLVEMLSNAVYGEYTSTIAQQPVRYGALHFDTLSNNTRVQLSSLMNSLPIRRCWIPRASQAPACLCDFDLVATSDVARYIRDNGGRTEPDGTPDTLDLLKVRAIQHWDVGGGFTDGTTHQHD